MANIVYEQYRQAIKDEFNFDLGENEFISYTSGFAGGHSITEYPIDQLLMGIRIEMEHTADIRQSVLIAMDHLEEISDYYDRLEDMEEEAEKMVKGGPGSGRHSESSYREVLDGMRHASRGLSPQSTTEHYMRGYESIRSGIGGKHLSPSEKLRVIAQHLYGKKAALMGDLEKQKEKINPKIKTRLKEEEIEGATTGDTIEKDPVKKGGPGSGRHPIDPNKHEQIQSYIRGIRNPHKQNYAREYYQAMREDKNTDSVNRGKLSVMGAQAVRIGIHNIINKFYAYIELQKGGIGSGKYAADDKAGSHGHGLVKRLHRLHYEAIKSHQDLSKHIKSLDKNDLSIKEKQETLKNLESRILKIRGKLRDWEVLYPSNKD